MNLKRGIVLICLVALSSFIFAQSSVFAQASINGTWTGEAPGGRGPVPVTLTLKADGTKVTGTVGGGRGGPVDIKEGTLMGANLKFKTTNQGRGGEVTLNWTGTVKGDEIAFSRMAEGGNAKPVEFTVKKEK